MVFSCSIIRSKIVLKVMELVDMLYGLTNTRELRNVWV